MNCSNTRSDNAQMAKSLGREMAVAAGAGAKVGGLHGALAGAGIAAVQNVAFGLMDHGPVNVSMPHVPMRPSHIGQSGNNNSATPNLPMGPSWTRPQ